MAQNLLFKILSGISLFFKALKPDIILSPETIQNVIRLLKFV
jgi:hypothetical protein